VETYLDCIPCFIRQTLDAVRLTTLDEKSHETVLRKVLAATGRMDLTKSPPQMGQFIHRIIREFSGNQDPYKKHKEHFNRFALNLYPDLKKKVELSPEPIETAARLAIAGNIIDFGVNTRVDNSYVNETIELSLQEQLFGKFKKFIDAVNSAKNILYLGDNTGEIVFDRLLIEQLPKDKVIYAVRGSPVINDATMDDAVDTGMTKLVRVIDNGSDAPGTILEECSDVFMRAFSDADLIISKGQGNYETLSHVDKNSFFLLKVKCEIVASDIGCDVGRFVAKHKA
jgi:damage-control phosphatase, subfamily I